MSLKETDFTCGLVNNITFKKINLLDDPNGEPMAEIDAIILEES